MEAGKQYKVISPDGLPFGYFLDNRLYEYLTSTCVATLNESGQLINKDEVLGQINGDQILKRDGTLLHIEQ